MGATSSESYAPVSRGLREHLPTMSGNAVKLYLDLLLNAAFSGPNKGHVAVSFAELALRLRMHKQTIHKAARELRPYFIDWSGAKNQHGVTVFAIQKYKSIKDFAVSRAAHTEVTAHHLPDEKIDQRVNGTLTAPSAIDTIRNQLTSPKKLKKIEKEAAACQEDSVWNFLKIRPCGPVSFRTFLESRWASQNGEKRSVLIGDSIDAWEAAEGDKLQRSPSLFRALSELRNQERSARPQTDAKLRRIPTSADIRPKER
ncbi:MAG: hypothetical protein WAU89_02165 [Candidatus Acidiferrales bacterium]